ncbi:MAG: hypothetical protein IIT53_02255 [Fibrobacter sp.]|nr:hypothetical protein [Fibrobacter sp.]
MKTISQTEQVIAAMEKEGGFATFKRLNEIVDFSKWKTKTPEASVRRIVQDSDQIFKIRPGLWALEKYRKEVLLRLDLKIGDKKSEQSFDHGYYQGLLVEIGKFKKLTTYIPAQDKNRKFLGKRLVEVANTTDIPHFTHDSILRKAKTVDVIWFNERNMPSVFYEVEHTTDIKNSLSKFYELQDFFAEFFIVAAASRKNEFDDKLNASIFNPIKERVIFLDYDKVVKRHEGLLIAKNASW